MRCFFLTKPLNLLSMDNVNDVHAWNVRETLIEDFGSRWRQRRRGSQR